MTARLWPEQGFSLIELIMVILLVGVLVAVVTPSGTVVPSLRLQAAAERVASDIRYAQALSLKEGGHVGVSFQISGNSYSVLRNGATPVTDPMNGGQNLALNFANDDRFSGVSLLSADFAAGSLVQFDNLGAPRDVAYMEMPAQGMVILAQGTLRDTVRVEAVTGKVTF